MAKYLNVKELCEEMKVSRSTIYTWKNDGMPFEKWGKLIRFDIEAVYEWLKNRNK